MHLVLSGRLPACLAEARPWVPQTDLLAVGIQVDQQVQDQAAGNLQGLSEEAQERAYPCLPWVDLPLTGLPLAWWVGATVGQEASAPLLEVVVSGKAAGPQGLWEEQRSAWDLKHSCPSS